MLDKISKDECIKLITKYRNNLPNPHPTDKDFFEQMDERRKIISKLWEAGISREEADNYQLTKPIIDDGNFKVYKTSSKDLVVETNKLSANVNVFVSKNGYTITTFSLSP